MNYTKDQVFENINQMGEFMHYVYRIFNRFIIASCGSSNLDSGSIYFETSDSYVGGTGDYRDGTYQYQMPINILWDVEKLEKIEAEQLSKKIQKESEKSWEDERQEFLRLKAIYGNLNEDK